MFRKLTLTVLLLTLLVVPTLAQDDVTADTTFDAGTYTFLYPEGWVTLEDPDTDAVLVAPDQSVIDEFTQDNAPPSDLFIFTYGDEFVSLLLDLEPGAEKPDIMEAGNALLGVLGSLPMLPEMSDLQETTMEDGRSAASALLQHDDETGLAGVFLIINDNGTYIGLMAVVPSTIGLEAWIPVLQGVGESLSVGGSGPSYILNWYHDDFEYAGFPVTAALFNDQLITSSRELGLVIATLDGEVVDQFSTEDLGIDELNDVAVDSEGNVWILEVLADTIWKVSVTGEVLGSFSYASEDESSYHGGSQLSVTTDDKLALYGSIEQDDNYLDHIWVFNTDMELVSEFDVDPGDGWVDLVVAASEGNIMVIFNEGGANLYTSEGEIVAEGVFADILDVGGYISGYSLLSDNTMIFLDPSYNLVHFNSDGEILNRISARQLGIDNFRNNLGIVMAPNGDLIVADAIYEGSGRLFSFTILPAESSE